MEQAAGPSQLLKKLEKYIYALKPARNLNKLIGPQREKMLLMTRNVSLAKAQVEYSLADEAQAARRQGLELAIEQLDNTIQAILAASMLDLIDTVDVAQLTSMAEMAIEQIKALE